MFIMLGVFILYELRCILDFSYNIVVLKLYANNIRFKTKSCNIKNKIKNILIVFESMCCVLCYFNCAA